MALKPILEINAKHPLVKALQGKAETGTGDDFEDLSWLLLDEARILEGGTPTDPAAFSKRLNRLLVTGV